MTPRRLATFFAILCVLLLGAACSRDSVDAPVAGVYRGVLEVPGGQLPFGLELEKEGGGIVLYLVNAEERIRVPDVRVQGDRLEAVFPGFENTLEAHATVDGLKGEVTLVKAGGVQQVIPFAATLGDVHRFFAEPATDNADVEGRWAVTFAADSGETKPAVAEFVQSHDRVVGTFLTPTGDHRFLAGQVRGEELHLSTFDGAHAYLYRARVDEKGDLSGDFWSGTKWHETWTARRDPTANLAVSGRASRLIEPAERLDFTFPNLAGEPVSLSDPRYQGKVVIVAIGGSWCPNCHDEAAFLAALHREYRDDGLEVIGLMFEHFEQFEPAVNATRRFRERHGIEYETLIAGVSDKAEASAALPALDGIHAYPTTIFLDRNGEVRKVHTGFSGPATGFHYARLTGDFTALVQTLLAEGST